jgi:protein phosphatase
VLVDVADPAVAVDRIIELANDGGGPDNITCVVADLVDDVPADGDASVFGASVFGAAAEAPTTP